jgi:hypothetical protein
MVMMPARHRGAAATEALRANDHHQSHAVRWPKHGLRPRRIRAAVGQSSSVGHVGQALRPPGGRRELINLIAQEHWVAARDGWRL